MIFVFVPLLYLQACKESYQHSCCRYLISSMHDVLGCSVDLVAQFLVPMTDLMATFHSPEFVHRWDPFSARLCVGAYMVLETTAEVCSIVFWWPRPVCCTQYCVFDDVLPAIHYALCCVTADGSLRNM